MVTVVYTVTRLIVVTTVKRVCMKMIHVTLNTQVKHIVIVVFKMITSTVIGLTSTTMMINTYAYGILLVMVLKDTTMLQIIDSCWSIVIGLHRVCCGHVCRHSWQW